jgi:transposase
MARFPTADCRAYPARAKRVRAPKAPRAVTFRPKEQHLALQKARNRQTTEESKEIYAQRAGVKRAISQGTRVYSLRRSRYMGIAKTHLQHVFTARPQEAINRPWPPSSQQARPAHCLER